MSLTVEKAKVIELLYAAVDDLNLQLRKDARLEKSPATALTGDGGRLDSLGLLNLLVFTEQRIETAFGASVMLADDEAMAKEPSPFRNLDALADHATALLNRNLH
jgi:acyl carrier protein